MAISTVINYDAAAAVLRQECTKGMIEAAEPVIQQAMKDIERKLRQHIGSIVVGMIQQDINVMSNGREVVIKVIHREG